MATAATDIQTTIDFIADLSFYEEGKPYFLHPSVSANLDVDQIKTTNVQWNTTGVTVQSMRDRPEVSLERTGFCYVQHESRYFPGPDASADTVANYSRECEDLLRSLFDAEFVRCYDYKMRKSSPMALESYDPDDPLLVEQVAVGAHDISIDTVPRLLKEVLNEEQLSRFFQPGYRFRMINTWRSILPECQDRPLAMCDYTSIDPTDLVATDRIYPMWNQEIYSLKHSKNQRWFWLPKQRSDEPFLFMTYDSRSGSNARYCPHVSAENPLAEADAPPRESVETRNLVISKM
ncbi:hypothetical protein NCS56_01305400 [Fusarium sp. Ph1]|nr:hypothetical protein NCS56_01305400 [Fusarium sp. Ph1]